MITTCNSIYDFQHYRDKTSKSDFILWQRLRHVSSLTMCLIPDLKYISSKASHYFICPPARQHRVHFPSMISRTQPILELIHTDIWGPYPISNVQGKLLPNHSGWLSRATWSYLMNLKSDVLHLLHSFFKLVKTQFNTNIKHMRTDSAWKIFKFEYSLFSYS